jgi:hypothetical protein
MKYKIEIDKLNNPNDRKEIINTFTDDDLKEIFNSLNDLVQNKNFSNFMNLLQENSKNLAISLSLLDKKKEKALTDKLREEIGNSIDEKLNMLGKTNKKDYIILTIEICHSALLKKGYVLKLPYELWSLEVFAKLFSEAKLGLGELRHLLTSISEILNLQDDQFLDKQDEIAEYVKKLFNSF